MAPGRFVIPLPQLSGYLDLAQRNSEETEGRRGMSTDQLARINQISFQIIGAAIRIHRQLGSGLLESAYHDLMRRDLTKQGFC